MNEKKLKQLFDAARPGPAPEPPWNFPARVLGAIRREPRTLSLAEQLSALFPRFALAAALLLAAGLGVNYWMSRADTIGFTTDTAALTEEWLFVAADN